MRKLIPAILIALAAISIARADPPPDANTAKLHRLTVRARQTAIKIVGDGVIDSVSRASEDGKTVYDVEFTRAGVARGCTVASDGELLDMEVFLDELPAPARASVCSTTGGLSIGEIDCRAEDGKKVYDVDWLQGGPSGKSRRFTVGADGKLVETQTFFPETPAAVQKTARKFGPVDDLVFTRRIDNGTNFYDVAMPNEAHSWTLDQNGAIKAEDAIISLADAPPPVQAAIQKRLGQNGRLHSITKQTEDGEIQYDVELTAGGRRQSPTFATDGTIVPDEK